ncbi:MFS transporter [Roseomonas gilardii]|uniref:MFS transporter n=1 Tax=Roseomonas gilardii TaxID=257708 RepID=A0ABU3MJL8_9PROT|nr:MFS transporter [Roseomonas gilardii]MDT8333201.1 MFS transporter [Roseomonas gilardii]
MSADDIGQRVRERDMTPFQMLVVGICIFINLLDGFDVLAMAFTAPAIAKEWGLKPTELGILFSAGLAGMATGSVLLSPLADRYGRRASVLLCLTLMTIGMLLSAMSQGTTHLLILRFVTGLGIGGVLPGINTLIAEYASRKRRDLCIGLMTMGYAVGATIGGIMAVFLISNFGWHYVFLVGGILSALTAVLVALVMPESIDFMLARRPPDALGQVNQVLSRLRLPPLVELPAVTTDRRHRTEFGTILSGGMRRITFLVCASFFLAMMTFYFLLNWTPKILFDLGLSMEGGISGAVLMNVAGVVGGVLLGWGTNRFGLARLTIAYMTLCFVSVVVFGVLPTSAFALLCGAFAIGFFMNGVIVGLYALVPTVYPPAVRATGAGLALGCGRLGATVGPLLAGLLIAGGWSHLAYFTVMALPMLLAAFVIGRIGAKPPGVVAMAAEPETVFGDA